MSEQPVPRKWYSYADFQRMVGKLEADQLAVQGYVLQQDINMQMIRIIPWHEASGRREIPIDKRTHQKGAVEITERRIFTPIDPIPEFQKENLPKRRPVDRVDSLAARMMLHIQATGLLPGEEDREFQAQINEIVGEAWKAGRTEITGEVIRKVAASMLAKAEKQRQVDQFKKVTQEVTT